MIDINEIYLLVRFIANENQRKKFNGDEFNIAANAANRARFNELLGLPEQYAPGQPEPAVAFELTADIMGKLAPFVSDPIEIPVGNSGKGNKPAGYIRYTALRRIVTIDDAQHEKEVTVARRASLGNRLDSSVIPPTYEYPLAVEYSTYFQFFPKVAGNAILEHLRMPKDVKWNFAADTRREIYKAEGSIHFEWNPTEFNNLAIRILQSFSINIRDADLAGFAARAKAEGA